MQFMLRKLMSALKPGRVYRRSELSNYSTSIDRDLKALQNKGVLKKLRPGIYATPLKTVYGEGLPSEKNLLKTFLNDDHFVVYSLNDFNSLGLGTTQLYNYRIVFNRKRSGEFVLGGKTYHFYRWREAPKTLSKEFLVVEIVNRLKLLAEDQNLLLKNLETKIHTLNLERLKLAVKRYGTYSTQLKFENIWKKNDFRISA